MANKSKKAKKPTKKDVRKQANADLKRELEKAKRALVDEKARAKKSAKKAKEQSRKDVAKAKKKAVDTEDAARKTAKKAAKNAGATVKAQLSERRAAVASKPEAATGESAATVTSLRAKARAQGIAGYSRLTKDQLLAKLK